MIMSLTFLQRLVGCKDCPPDSSAEIVTLENTISILEKQNATLSAKVQEWVAHSAGLKAQLDDLEAQIKAGGFEPPNPKEKYWNTKYPADETVRWTCRYIHLANGEMEACQVDPRVFFQPTNGDLKAIVGGILASFRLKNGRDPSYDEWALECLRWVRKHISYKTDKNVEGIDEYWQFWYETLELHSGDCEDGSILLANLMMVAGIPYWRVRLNAGDVNGGGHAYVTYCRETDDEFVILDWCYWPNDLLPKDRKLHRDESNYSGHDFGIWWSWNSRFCFRKVTYAEGEK